MFFNAVNYALLGDFVEPDNKEILAEGMNRTSVKVLWLAALFLTNISLMNVFIATLTNSFNVSANHAQQLFYHRIAQSALWNLSVQHGVWRMLGRPISPK